MPYLRNTVPLLSVAILTLIAALPFGMPTDGRFYMPLLPYTAIHYWAVRRPGLMPEWGVFLAGLMTDVLTHGPLGFWALMFLAGLVVINASRNLPDWGALGRWAQFCVTLAVMGVCEWLVASLYFFELADWKPIVIAIGIGALSYPLLGLLLRPLLGIWLRSEHADSIRSTASRTLVARPTALTRAATHATRGA
jgi:rod shape-determining protein MreD